MKHISMNFILFILCLLLLTGCSETDIRNVITSTEGMDTNSTYIAESTDAIPESKKIVSESFVLMSGDYALNAVYTFVDDNKTHPTVLLLAGSGPADYDETVGSWKPFKDIAEGLAGSGINSLRVDKRTLNYGKQFKTTDGVEEEYLIDGRAALTYISSMPGTGDIYILGHSLGGQIATVLAKEYDNIKGIILFNSSGRHLAEIACDQYILTDSENRNSYMQYRNTAMSSTINNVKGYYYFGATDYYWADYNKIDTVENIKSLKIPVLIINSISDAQIFDADIDLWRNAFTGYDYINIVIDDKINHSGYEKDVSDPTAFISSVKFPDRIIQLFSAFCNEYSKIQMN